MPRRLFTPAEANRTLPLVRRIVEDILAKGREFRSLSAQRRAETEERLEELHDELYQLFDELDGVGCSYKDWGFEMGLVDFPAVIDGTKVLLCWRTDEPTIKWYHTPEAGFAGRTLIPAALLAE